MSECADLIAKYGSSKRGLIHENQCYLYLLQSGYNVSVPLGNYCPYDFILDAEGTLFKIQCKSPTYHENGSIRIAMYTVSDRKHGLVQYNSDQVDFFASFYDGTCYLIPFDYSRTSAEIYLRLELPQCKVGWGRMHWGLEFEANYVINRRLHPETTPELDFESELRLSTHNFIKCNAYLGTYHWITNGKENRKLYDGEIPEGFRLGRVMNTK